MNFDVDIKITRDRTPELMQKLDAAIGRFVRKGAGYIEGELKTSMTAAKSGKQYKRGKDGIHIASAPGESPAVDSSNLIGSIQQIFPSTLEAKIGTNVEYAVMLEAGTSRMAARPLWEKTAKDALPTLEKMLAEEVKGV